MSGLVRALEAICQETSDLYAFEVEGIDVIFRLPSVKVAQQYAMLLGMSQSESEKTIIYEHIFRNTVQDDWLANQYGDLKAGLPETVALLVLKLSGLDESSTEYTEELFKVYREQSGSTITYMKRVICMVFSGYTFELLDQLNYQNLVNVFIQAEKVLLERGIIESEHNFKSPESAKEAPFKVEDIIKRDKDSYKDFDSANREDPRKQAYMQKIREGAKKRAEEEERKFKKQMAQQVG